MEMRSVGQTLPNESTGAAAAASSDTKAKLTAEANLKPVQNVFVKASPNKENMASVLNVIGNRGSILDFFQNWHFEKK